MTRTTGVHILSADPTIAPGYAAAIGERASWNGVIYVKTGAADTAWTVGLGPAMGSGIDGELAIWTGLASQGGFDNLRYVNAPNPVLSLGNPVTHPRQTVTFYLASGFLTAYWDGAAEVLRLVGQDKLALAVGGALGAFDSLRIDNSGNLILGAIGIDGTATHPWVGIQQLIGAPLGTPNLESGAAAYLFDRTALGLWFYVNQVPNVGWHFIPASGGPAAASVASTAANYLPDNEPGEQGDMGPPGPIGPQGIQGLRGVDGTDGLDGEDGRPGPTGIVGPQGLQGPQGDQGEEGPEGPIGPVGQTGATGAAGAAGSNGSAGAAGANGLQGPPGEDGADGEQGPPGPAGPCGAGFASTLFTQQQLSIVDDGTNTEVVVPGGEVWVDLGDCITSANLKLTLAGIFSRATGNGTVRVRMGGTIGTVDGTTMVSVTVSATSETGSAAIGSAIATSGITGLLKITAQPATSGTLTLRGLTVTGANA